MKLSEVYKKEYIGKGKTDQYGNVRITLKTEDMDKYIWFNDKGDGYLTCTVSRMKNVDQYENTHTVYVYVKTGIAEQTAPQPIQAQPNKEYIHGTQEDLPF